MARSVQQIWVVQEVWGMCPTPEAGTIAAPGIAPARPEVWRRKPAQEEIVMKRFSMFLLALFLLVVFVDNAEARDRRRAYYYSAPSYYTPYYTPYATDYVVPSGEVRSYEYVQPSTVTRS